MIASILPLIIAVIGAAITKRIIPSLVAGLLVGSFVKTYSFIGTFLTAGDYISTVASEKDNVYIILFLFCFGALAEIFKVGGGISGFAKKAENYFKSEKGSLLSVWAVTPITFLDCCFHVIATTTITKPMIDKSEGSKEKLAFIINTTSSQLIVLIPFATTYVGYILGVIASSMERAGMQGSPYMVYLNGVFLNFYSISILILSITVIFFEFKFKFMAALQPALRIRTKAEGEHDSHEAHEQGEYDEKIKPRAMNLLVPLIVLITAITYLLWLTGHTKGGSFGQAIVDAQYEKAIFVATIATLVFTAIYYVLQKIPMKNIESSFLTGGVDLLPPIVILILAWAITDVTKDLGFVGFISELIKGSISYRFVPAAIFIVSGVASYFMGSSWGTWALIMPIAVSLVVSTGANLPLTIGAVLAGGSIGDNISPLGETPVTTASLLDIPIAKHVSYMLPYGLVAIAISAILYLIIGYST